MTPEEIATKLRQGGQRLAFDTNAMWNLSRFMRLCTSLQRLNYQLEGVERKSHELIVCTVAHTEVLMDLKQEYQDRFDHQVILEGIKAKQLVIHDFTAEHALSTAEHLGKRYADGAAWKEAKKRRYMESLGMNPNVDKVPSSGSSCSATIDWLIVGHARGERCILVTNERGIEFKGVIDRVPRDMLENAVQQILSEFP